MRPLRPQFLHKPNTGSEAFLLIVADRRLLGKAQLQLDCRHHRRTISQKRIRDKEPFLFEKSQKMDDPVGMRGNHVRRMLQENLRDHPPMVAQRQRQQQRMVQQTQNGMIQELAEKPRTPIVPVRLQVLQGPVGRVGVLEAVRVRHARLDFHLQSDDLGVLRLRRPRRMVVWFTSPLDVGRRARKGLADQDDVGDDAFVTHAARDASLYGARVGHVRRDPRRFRPGGHAVLAGEVEDVEILALQTTQETDAPETTSTLFQPGGIGSAGWLRCQVGAPREIHGKTAINGGMVRVSVCQR